MNELEIQQELARVVAESVRYYSSRCRWADPEDMRQEGWIAAEECRLTWKPERGPIAAYASRAIRWAIAFWLIRNSSPVSASWHARHELLNHQHAPLEAIEEGLTSRTARAPAVDQRGWADDVLDDRQWRVRVMSRLLTLVGDDPETGLDALVTKKVGLRKRWVIAALANAKDTIKNDPELKELWEEREGEL